MTRFLTWHQIFKGTFPVLFFGFPGFDLVHFQPVLLVSGIWPRFFTCLCLCGIFGSLIGLAYFFPPWTLKGCNLSSWNIRSVEYFVVGLPLPDSWNCLSLSSFFFFYLIEWTFKSSPGSTQAKNVQFWLRGAPPLLAWPSVVTENNILAQVCGGATSVNQIINTLAPAFELALHGMKMGANERFLCSKSTLVANIQALSDHSQL